MQVCQERCCPGCPGGQKCVDLRCQHADACPKGCGRGKVCSKAGKCVQGRCEEITPFEPCPRGFVCRKGVCR